MEHSKKNKNLNKIILDFDKTCEWFKKHITSKNELSKTVLEKINFGKGQFFTMLPENGDLSLLYKFSTGGILSILPTEEEKYVLRYSETPTIDKEITNYIFEFLKKNSNNFAFFINPFAEITDPNIKIKNINLLNFNDQFYYLINLKTANEINTTIQICNHGWYFLCVLSSDVNIKSSLEKADFDRICNNLSYIITCAYDREGYVFWEPKK